MNVLVTTPATVGHVHPMVPLARAIALRGHDVLWAIPADGVADLERRGMRAAAAAPAMAIGPALARQRFPELAAMAVEKAPEVMFAKLWGAIAAPAMLDGLLPIAQDWRPDLVICDAAELAGHIVAAELGVPSITKGFGALLPADRVSAAGDEVADLWRSRGLEPRPFAGCYETLYLDPYPPSLQAQDAAHIGRRHHVHPGGDVEKAGVSTDAPMPAEGSASPLVYVTMGTMFNDSSILQTVIDAVADLDARALVTVGPTNDPDAYDGRSSRIRVERYVPQTAILPHCAAVVCHGGSGTALGALASGLPVVCLPQGADQFINAAAIVASGAGLAVTPDRLAVAAVAEAIRRVLDEPAFGAAAQRISAEIAAMPSVDEVAQVIEALA